jgi:heme a synthase
MRVPELSPRALRTVMLVNVGLLVAIVVSGAAVRLTNSGLGCDNWPNCSATKLVDVSSNHAAIEQLNRIFSGLIGVPLGIALVGAYRLRPRRRDLIRLAWLLFVLFWMQAVLGGITVILELAWFSVMSHFLLAIALIGIALTMLRKSAEPDGPRERIVSATVERLAQAVYGLTIVVLMLGTLVTAAGPHGGDEDARRLDVPLRDVARVHGVAVDILVALTLLLVVALLRDRAPKRVLTTASIAVAVMTAQGILGYVQYANEIPALLVGFHVFGATCVFVAVQQLVLELRSSADQEPTRVEPDLRNAPFSRLSRSRANSRV